MEYAISLHVELKKKPLPEDLPVAAQAEALVAASSELFGFEQ